MTWRPWATRALASGLGLAMPAPVEEAVDAFALRTLAGLQRDALARRSESCGYICRQAGVLRARSHRGNREFCDATRSPSRRTWTPIARTR